MAVLSDSVINGNLRANGNSYVSGLQYVLGTLTAVGKTSLTDLDVSSNETISGILTVTGESILNNKLTVAKATYIKDTLTVDGAVTNNSTFTNVGATYLKDTLTVDKAVTNNSTLTTVGATHLKDTLTVDKAVTNNSTLVNVGAVTINNKLQVDQAVTNNSTLLNVGSVHFNNTLTVDKAVTNSSTLTNVGAATFNSTLTVNDSIKGDKNLTIDGTTSLNSTLTVTGAMTGNSTLKVAGDSTLQGALTLTKNAQLNDTLTVEKGSTLKGAVQANSTLSVNGVTTLYSTLNVSDNISTDKNAIIKGSTTSGSIISNGNTKTATLTVTGDSTIGGALTVTGNLTVKGTTTTQNTNVETLNYKRIEVDSTSEVALDSASNDSILIGTATSTNLGIDANELQARNNGAASTLYLNPQGGNTDIGSNLYVHGSIGFVGSSKTRSVISFVDGSDNGTGIKIGGCGTTAIFSGESINQIDVDANGEELILASDQAVQITTNLNSGASYGKTFTFGADGVLTSPNGFVGNLTGTVTGSLVGNADTVTNGVYTTGDQTIAGTKTFSSNIVGNLTGNCSGSSSSTSYVSYTGAGKSCLTAYQSSSAFQGSEAAWASYIICNHGDGSSYYNQTIRLPFQGVPQYQRLVNGTQSGWKTFITSENIASQTVANCTGNAATATKAYTIPTAEPETLQAGSIWIVQ